MKPLPRFLAVFAAIVCGLLAPYIFVGETWGMVLFQITKPTSTLWKHYGHSVGADWIEIATVTFIHALLVALAICLVWAGWSKIAGGKQS